MRAGTYIAFMFCLSLGNWSWGQGSGIAGPRAGQMEPMQRDTMNQSGGVRPNAGERVFTNREGVSPTAGEGIHVRPMLYGDNVPVDTIFRGSRASITHRQVPPEVTPSPTPFSPAQEYEEPSEVVESIERHRSIDEIRDRGPRTRPEDIKITFDPPAGPKRKVRDLNSTGTVARKVKPRSNSR